MAARRQREVGAQRKSQQSNALRIDLRLASHEADRVPQSLHPDGEVAEDGLQTIDLGRAGAVEIMQHVNCEALPGQKARRVGHRRVPASGTMQPDDRRKALPVGIRQKAIQTNVLAAALE